MSEEKLASPLLDGFLMGSPMSEHNGVTCCPAMKEDSDRKYIVKIISVPASQKQLEALQLGKVLQALGLGHYAVRQLLEVGHGILGPSVGTGQQQGIQLLLGSGTRDDLDNVLSI